jgi:hypothetical protein
MWHQTQCAVLVVDVARQQKQSGLPAMLFVCQALDMDESHQFLWLLSFCRYDFLCFMQVLNTIVLV